ncbi:MAG: SH3 domain-containing protein [Anaerolineae bacterium]|nr:SH3 domain-containing protein [Anaerolineae bacterium]
MHSRTAFSRMMVVFVALLVATLACNLQRGGDEPTSVPTSNAQRPTVEILEPAEGAQVTRGQSVSVKARATGASGVTLVELRVNNLVVDSQVPAEALSPTTLEVLLDYKAEQTGLVSLSVTAYSNTIAGQPAIRSINVVDTLDPGAGGQGTPQNQQTLAPTPTTYNPLCRARINVGLNFRTGPGTEYDKILTFSAGQEPPITGYADRTDGRWWQVSWGGQLGWVNASYTTQLGDCSAIRPAQVPLSPTPVPSETPQPTQPGATSTPTLPDLQLTTLEGVQVIDLDASGKATATYVIRVRNNGGQASGQFRIAVALPDGGTQLLDVPGLNTQQEFEVPSGGLNVTFASPGTKRLLVTVDSDNNVAESNESNNQAYIDVTVNPGPEPENSGDSQSSNGAEVADAAPAPKTESVEVASVDNAESGDGEAIPPIEQAGADTGDSAEPPSDQGDSPEPAGENDNNEGAAQAALVLPVITSDNVGQVTGVAVLQGHGGTVDALAFSPDGSLLVSASWDGTARLWNMASQAEIAILAGHMDRVVDVAFSPDGTRVVTASWDGTVRVWDVSTGAEVTMSTPGAEINAVAWSADGSQVAMGAADGVVWVWEPASGSQTSPVTIDLPVSGVVFAGSGSVAVTGVSVDCASASADAGIWNTISGESTGTLADYSGSVNALAISPNNALLAGAGTSELCGGSGVVWLWNAGTGARQAALDHGGGAVLDVAFGPSGALLVSGSGDGTVRVWDITSGAQRAVLQGHSSEVTGVAFSPNGQVIASGGADGDIRLWGVQ